jgi:hypothetical protein
VHFSDHDAMHRDVGASVHQQSSTWGLHCDRYIRDEDLLVRCDHAGYNKYEDGYERQTQDPAAWKCVLHYSITS